MKIRESCLQTGNFIYKPGISLTKQDFHLQRGSLGLQRGFSGYYLPENLQSVIKAKNWEAEVIADVNHGDLQSLKREGVNLFLIPEDIARYIDYSSVSKDECFKLTHDEYESGNIDRVVKYIEEN